MAIHTNCLRWVYVFPWTQHAGVRHWLIMFWCGAVEAVLLLEISEIFNLQTNQQNQSVIVFCIFIPFTYWYSWVSRKRWHRAVLCPSSALKPLLMVESRDCHNRYCPLCFSTSSFCSKLLNILEMYFISMIHTCATGD